MNAKPARLLATVVVIAAGCSGGHGGAPTTTSAVAASEPSTVATGGRNSAAPGVAAAIDGFDPGALRSSLFVVTDAALADPALAREAALGALASADPAVRFAAVYVLTLCASTEDEPSMQALRELADSNDPTERTLAGATLAALGERSGVDVLVEALAEPTAMRNVDPAMAVWRYARAQLVVLVRGDVGGLGDAGDLESAVRAQRVWRTWWADHGPTATWNPDAGRYETT